MGCNAAGVQLLLQRPDIIVQLKYRAPKPLQAYLEEAAWLQRLITELVGLNNVAVEAKQQLRQGCHDTLGICKHQGRVMCYYGEPRLDGPAHPVRKATEVGAQRKVGTYLGTVLGARQWYRSLLLPRRCWILGLFAALEPLLSQEAP